MPPQQLSAAVEDLIKEELQYSVGGVAPLPAFIVEAKGAKLWVCYLDLALGPTFIQSLGRERERIH